MSANTSSNNNKNSHNIGNRNQVKNGDSEEDQSPRSIPPRRDRTPSIVVQSLGISFNKDSNITESIELPADEEDCLSDSNEAEPRSSTSGVEDLQNDGSGGSKGSLSSLLNSSPIGPASPVRSVKTSSQQQYTMSKVLAGPGTNRRLSLNIGSTAPRRQSLTVEGLSSFASPAYSTGSATGSLRNKVALKPGHSLMGWIKLASTAKNLSGTNGKIIEVTPEELAKHDTEDDCWVALKGNVYNVSTYLQYHPGGVEELMRGAGRDITELFNEVHRWVNYESILAKCLVGPYKIESPLSPAGRASFATLTEQTSSDHRTGVNKEIKTSEIVNKRDPTIAQKPPRRQSIALTVPSANKYQSLLLNNNSSTNMNQIQQPPNYVIIQDKSCIKVKIQNLVTLPIIRSRHLICDLNEQMELNVSVILSSDWLYRVHLRLDQEINQTIHAELATDDETITIQLNKKEAIIWNKIGTSLDLNDSLCEMTLADKFFRPCQLLSKHQLTHDTYLFEFKLKNTLMYVPIGWHILIREHHQSLSLATTDDYRVHKNYTPVLSKLSDNDGRTDESGFMDRLYFIIKIYPGGVLTSKLNQLEVGDSVEISDYQSVDFDVESLSMNPKHWFLFAAGSGITPFCRVISFLLKQSEDNVKSVNLIFFNKTQNDIIWQDEFDQLVRKSESRFKVTHMLSNEPEKGDKIWTGRRGRINKDLVAELIDSHNPDELQLLACGPRVFTQLTRTIVTELNLYEKLYVFHG